MSIFFLKLENWSKEKLNKESKNSSFNFSLFCLRKISRILRLYIESRLYKITLFNWSKLNWTELKRITSISLTFMDLMGKIPAGTNRLSLCWSLMSFFSIFYSLTWIKLDWERLLAKFHILTYYFLLLYFQFEAPRNCCHVFFKGYMLIISFFILFCYIIIARNVQIPVKFELWA